MTFLGKLITPVGRRRSAIRSQAAQTQTLQEGTYQAVADMGISLRSYREVAARLRSQWIAMFLVGVVAIAMLAGLYLDVTARAAIAGREIQSLEQQITVNERANADLETQIAILMSNQTLEQRAKSMGFEPVTPEQVQYVAVPGYFPKQAVTFVTQMSSQDIIAASPEFKQSLFEWLAEQMETASAPLTNSQP